MSFKWTTSDVANGDIVISREQDNTLNDLVGTINGGLDRENLPANCVAPGQIVPKSVAICNVARRLYEENTITAVPGVGRSYWWASATGFNERDNDLGGITLGAMQGGQTAVVAHVQNIDCEEGMLQILWKNMQWINSHLTQFAPGGTATHNGSLKSVFWLIKVDGNNVCQSRSYYMNWSNVKLECAIPISKGNHEVRIEYNFVNSNANDFTLSGLYNDTPIFHWWGGTMFTTNRIR